jgi:hypothetical protein
VNLPTISVSSSEEDIPAREDEDPHDSHLGSTFVPLATTSTTEQEAIQQSITPSVSVSWPTIGVNAINKFTTEGTTATCYHRQLFQASFALL